MSLQGQHFVTLSDFIPGKVLKAGEVCVFLLLFENLCFVFLSLKKEKTIFSWSKVCETGN